MVILTLVAREHHAGREIHDGHGVFKQEEQSQEHNIGYKY